METEHEVSSISAIDEPSNSKYAKLESVALNHEVEMVIEDEKLHPENLLLNEDDVPEMTTLEKASVPESDQSSIKEANNFEEPQEKAELLPPSTEPALVLSQSSVDAQLENVIDNIVALAGSQPLDHLEMKGESTKYEKELEHIQREISQEKKLLAETLMEDDDYSKLDSDNNDKILTEPIAETIQLLSTNQQDLQPLPDLKNTLQNMEAELGNAIVAEEVGGSLEKNLPVNEKGAKESEQVKEDSTPELLLNKKQKLDIQPENSPLSDVRTNIDTESGAICQKNQKEPEEECEVEIETEMVTESMIEDGIEGEVNEAKKDEEKTVDNVCVVELMSGNLTEIVDENQEEAVADVDVEIEKEIQAKAEDIVEETKYDQPKTQFVNELTRAQDGVEMESEDVISKEIDNEADAEKKVEIVVGKKKEEKKIAEDTEKKVTKKVEEKTEKDVEQQTTDKNERRVRSTRSSRLIAKTPSKTVEKKENDSIANKPAQSTVESQSPKKPVDAEMNNSKQEFPLSPIKAPYNSRSIAKKTLASSRPKLDFDLIDRVDNNGYKRFKVSDPSGMLNCPECRYSTNRINNLVYHVKQHTVKFFHKQVEKYKKSLQSPKRNNTKKRFLK